MGLDGGNFLKTKLCFDVFFEPVPLSPPITKGGVHPRCKNLVSLASREIILGGRRRNSPGQSLIHKLINHSLKIQTSKKTHIVYKYYIYFLILFVWLAYNIQSSPIDGENKKNNKKTCNTSPSCPMKCNNNAILDPPPLTISKFYLWCNLKK